MQCQTQVMKWNKMSFQSDKATAKLICSMRNGVILPFSLNTHFVIGQDTSQSYIPSIPLVPQSQNVFLMR